ncbi:MAG: biotin--[Clostridia bacterium]|nr:biotin--[acetyl-CoA-carboxylase] ligase [Clostridia bacterium]
MTEKTINGIKVHQYNCVDSTNRIALENTDSQHLLTIISDSQSGGKGRMGRKYFSYNGGLYMSVVLLMPEITIPINLCTPAAALAVKYALEECGIFGVKIKWVNDILLDNRKICGILTECRTTDEGLKNIVVGIGINLTKPEKGFPEEIKDRAGYAGYSGDKLILASNIANRLGNLVKSNPTDIVTQYEKNMAWIGENVTVTDYADNNKKITGTIIGVNEDCFLEIILNDKTEKVLSSGEII